MHCYWQFFFSDFVTSSLYCFFFFTHNFSSFMCRYIRARYVIILMIKALIDSTHYTVKLILTKASNYYFRQDGIIKKYTSKKAQNVCILFVIIFLLLYVYYTHIHTYARVYYKKKHMFFLISLSDVSKNIIFYSCLCILGSFFFS